MSIRAGIFGASGYSGMELAWLLARHPGVELVFATSDRWQGRTLGEVIPSAAQSRDLALTSAKEGEDSARDCDVVFLATPAEASLSLVQALSGAPRVRIVDLSGAFRLRDASMYPRWYGFEHSAPGRLAEARYGLVDWNASILREAALVANPGCYATVASLALMPLLAEDLIEPEIIIDAASGVTGAGRRSSEAYSLAELDGDVFAYKVLAHQHTPEIAQTLSAAARGPVDVTFTAHLLPIRRGILATSYARLKPGISPADARAAFSRHYATNSGVLLMKSPEEVRLRRVVGTNDVVIAISADEVSRRAVVVSALDNLIKGAAGQAVQCMNAMFGLPLLTAVDDLKGHMP